MVQSFLAALVSIVLAAPAAAADAGAGRAAFLRADYAQARSILRPLAQSDDAEAQYWLGVMYAQGRGYPADCEEAIRWYEAAARQGHREATFSLGFLLFHGSDAGPNRCSGDASAAAPWLRRAAERGEPAAQHLVGHMYATGEGLPRDRVEATYWLQQAAMAGVPQAQSELAVLYEETGDWVAAQAWYVYLAERGYPGARVNATRLSAKMTAAQLDEASDRARKLPSVD